MNILKYANRITQLENEKANLLAKAMKESDVLKAEIETALQKVFESNPTIVALGWRQNSPWCDGDEVVFSVGEINYIDEEYKNEYLSNVSFDGSDECYEIAFDALNEGSNWFNEYPPEVSAFFKCDDLMRRVLGEEAYFVMVRGDTKLREFAYDGY